MEILSDVLEHPHYHLPEELLLKLGQQPYDLVLQQLSRLQLLLPPTHYHQPRHEQPMNLHCQDLEVVL